ncbi:MAG: hypothetical protein IPP38_14335 [Bacteroidetes bacterium]|nr:hypothetical protein [Bacteroidota bacterium]
MKIKIEKGMVLISLASSLAIHSFDMFFVFVNYIPKASGYKNPMWIWFIPAFTNRITNNRLDFIVDPTF